LEEEQSQDEAAPNSLNIYRGANQKTAFTLTPVGRKCGGDVPKLARLRKPVLQPFLFLLKRSVDLFYQRHQLFRVLLNSGLFAQFCPSFFQFLFHGHISSLASWSSD